MSFENGQTHQKHSLLYWLKVISNGLNHKNGVIDTLHETISSESHAINDSSRMNVLNGTPHECENLYAYISKGFNSCHSSAKFAYLHRLVLHGCTDGLLDILEDSTDDFNKIRNHVGITLLHLASKHHMSNVVEKLITVGTNLNVKNHKGATPLHFAVRQDDVACVKLLLKHGANAVVKDNYGYTPMDYAKAAKALDCLKVLEKFIHDHKLSHHGLYRELSIEETQLQRKHTLEKRTSISIKNGWY